MFKNGNRRIARLVIWELIAGTLILVVSQILGALPSQDWLSTEQIKITAFIGGSLIAVLKGLEMFFSKTVTLFKNHEISLDDPPDVKVETEVKQTTQISSK